MNALGRDWPEWPILSEILARHGIPDRNVQIVEDGHINHVAVIEGEFVVRFSTDPAAEARLCQEASLVKSLQALIPTSEVLHCGKAGTANFQIRAYIRGESLADCWPGLSQRRKEATVEHLISILRILHEQTYAEFGYLCLPEAGGSSWRNHKLDEFDAITRKLRTDSLLPASLIHQAGSFFAAESVCFEHAEIAVLVHNDLWLGNVIVDDDRIAGVIDFELAQKAPRDAELFKIINFCEEPWQYGKQGEFRDFLQMFAQGYPELFSNPLLQQRLRLYELISLWKSFLFGLGQCPANADPGAVIESTERIIGGDPVNSRPWLGSNAI